MDIEKVRRKQELLETLNKRRYLLEIQMAKYGLSADPSIRIEIDEINQKIQETEHDLRHLKKLKLHTPSAYSENPSLGMKISKLSIRKTVIKINISDDVSKYSVSVRH